MTPSLLSVFSAIYIINLDSREDRVIEMASQLRRIGLSFEHERVIRFAALRPSLADGFPSVGARGCFISHLEVLKAAKQAGWETILILEDDANFVNDICDRLPAVVAFLSDQDFDFFYGGYQSNPELQSDLESKFEFSLLACDQPIVASHCIGLSKQAISQAVTYFESMLSRTPGIHLGGPMHVDGAYSWLRKDFNHFRSIISVPQIAFQRASRSDVHALQWFDRLPVIRDASEVFRKLKRLLIPLG
jgi:glycosyl transferase, family 25